MILYATFLGIGIALALFGWLLPLIEGILQCCWGHGGRVLIGIGVSWCVLVIMWMIWWSEWKGNDLAYILPFGRQWAMITVALLGWVVPLSKGIWRGGNYGRVLIGIGTVWGVLALWKIIGSIEMLFSF